MSKERTVIVDASVFITLAEIDALSMLRGLRGDARIPAAVAAEIHEPPASDLLDQANWLSKQPVVGPVQTPEMETAQVRAATHLGRDPDTTDHEGDIAVLTAALWHRETHGRAVVVLTDDKPLRKTCKALSIPVSGSIGVLVRAVERGDLDPEDAKAALVAMDEVGARLSASLLRRAERLIDDAGADDEAG